MPASKDIFVPQLNPDLNAWVQKVISPVANSLLGFDAAKTITNITAGTGITIVGGVITWSNPGGFGFSVAAVAPVAPTDGYRWVDSTTGVEYTWFAGEAAWVDLAGLSGGGGTSLTLSDTAPLGPLVGDEWIDTSSGIRYTYYDSTWAMF